MRPKKFPWRWRLIMLHPKKIMLLWASLVLLGSNGLELDTHQQGLEVKIAIRGLWMYFSVFLFMSKDTREHGCNCATLY
jgi:hypothetical protein